MKIQSNEIKLNDVGAICFDEWCAGNLIRFGELAS